MRFRSPSRHHWPSIRLMVHEPSFTRALFHGPPRNCGQLSSSQPEAVSPVDVVKLKRSLFAANVPVRSAVRPSAQLIVPATLLPFCVNTTSEVPKSFPVVSHLPSMRSLDVDCGVRFFGVFEAESVGSGVGFGLGVVGDGNLPPDAS